MRNACGPPLEQLLLGSVVSSVVSLMPRSVWCARRYVRQDSPVWRALHAGVLTSSTLNGALGVHEPSAVAQLGLPKHFVSHGKLLAAAANLCQPQHVPPPPAPLPSLTEAHKLNRCACCPRPLTCTLCASHSHSQAHLLGVIAPSTMMCSAPCMSGCLRSLISDCA